MTAVKSRFAPSPTGKVHIGNIRTAVVVWLFTRAQGGHFLLRIDDTDEERSREEYVTALKADLTWLGLNWDSTFRQRDPARMAAHADAVERLKTAGRLYPCYESAEELALKRKVALNQGRPPVYDRAALTLSPADRAALEAKGIRPHWRFKLDDTPIEWDDLVRGPMQFNPGDLSDPVMIREDGRPLYHLGSVVDDIDSGITHIVRGEDHVSNTAVHVQMFRALGAPIPRFAHLSLIADRDGAKLSKRLGSLTIEELREVEGVEASAILSLLGRLGTSKPVEAITDIAALVDGFDFSIFSRATPKLDVDDIYRLNEKIVHGLMFDDVATRVPAGVTPAIWDLFRPILTRVRDIADWLPVLHVAPNVTFDEAECAFLATALSVLPPGPFDADTWPTWTAALKPLTDRKGKDFFMPIRRALTGRDHGPEMAGLVALLGRDAVAARLTGACAC